jgi:hypothetical protein
MTCYRDTFTFYFTNRSDHNSSEFSQNPTVRDLPDSVKSELGGSIHFDICVGGGERHGSVSLVEYKLLDLQWLA